MSNDKKRAIPDGNSFLTSGNSHDGSNNGSDRGNHDDDNDDGFLLLTDHGKRVHQRACWVVPSLNNSATMAHRVSILLRNKIT